MLSVQVKAYHKALLFKNNRYIGMLSEGKHWIWKADEAIDFDMRKPFNSSIELNILLQDTELANALDIVAVKQSEIALQYENGLFKAVLGPGRHAFWKGIVEHTFQLIDISKLEITENIPRAVLVRSEVMSFLRVYTVESYEKALLYIDGKFSKELMPGVYYFWKNPIVITVYKTDMRQVQMEMNGQEILTKDKANLRINFSLQYKVTDLSKLVQNKEFDRQLYVLMQFALREHITAYTLDELLDKRDSIAPNVLAAVSAKAAEMGLVVLDCGIRDIILPGDVKDIMNQVLLAEKKAQANIIMRREETASTRSLLNTAKLMEENEMLFKLKEMEYVEKISDKISSLSVSGGGDLVSQLKQIFVPGKK